MAEDVKKLKEQAKDFSVLFGVRKRRSAVQKLGEIGTAEVVTTLVESLSDEDTEVQRFAFQGLNSLKDSDAQEVLRNVYVKTRNKALWQIIKKQQMFPSVLADRISFFSKIKVYDDIIDSVTEENFMQILDLILQIEDIENPADLILAIINKGIKVSEFEIIRKFVDSKNDVLFEVIDRKNWYPPDLAKKVMFLLMTERYGKLHDLLDGEDFRQILEIMSDPRFSMRKQALECLAQIDNQIVIDEICNIFIKDRNPHLGRLILEHGWAPQKARDRILFYLKTEFLDGYFIANKVDPLLIGGYLEIVHIRESLKEEDYVPLATFLSAVASQISKSEKVEPDRDSPLMEIVKKVREYLDFQKPQLVIDEIIYDFMQNRNRLLEYIVVKEGWAPENDDEKVEFYFRTRQEKKIVQLGERAVKPLFNYIKGVEGKEELQKSSEDLLKSFKSPLIIQQIFNLYFKTLDKKLEEIIREKDWQPEEKTDRALYFILSGQQARYKEIESSGYSILMETYQKMDVANRLKILEVLLQNQTETFDVFMLDLFELEKNPRIYKLLSSYIKQSYKRLRKHVLFQIKRMDAGALKEIIKTLAEIKTDESSEMLFEIAMTRKGYICFWILKLLEEARWQPKAPHDRAFFYELYKIRDEMLRIIQNRLVDSDAEVRSGSALDLARMGDERLLHNLMKYIEDPVEEVRTSLAYAIGQLCALSPRSALEQIENFRIGSIYMIFNDVRKAFMVDAEQQQVHIIARNYDVGNAVLRTFAISTLEGLRRAESVPALIKALTDHEVLVKKSALKALVDVGDETCISHLMQRLDDKDKDNRLLAAEALGGIMDIDTVEKLEKKLSTGDFGYSDSVITALAKKYAERCKELFRRINQRPDFDLDGKAAAIIAMGKLTDPEIIDYLVNAWRNLRLSTDRQDGWLAYIQAFKSIGTMDAFTILDEMFKVGNWEIRRGVIDAMGNIPDRIALVTIIKAFEEQNGWIQMAALEAFNYYWNNYFVFKETEKDLKFIAAIIGRLKKFQLAEIGDKNFPIYQVEAQLMVSLLKNQLTKFYLEAKDAMSPEGQARRAAEEEERAKKEETEPVKGDLALWEKLKLGQSRERLTGAQLMEKIKAAQAKQKESAVLEPAKKDGEQKSGFALRKITTTRPSKSAEPASAPGKPAAPAPPVPEKAPTRSAADILKGKMKDGFVKNRLTERRDIKPLELPGIKTSEDKVREQSVIDDLMGMLPKEDKKTPFVLQKQEPQKAPPAAPSTQQESVDKKRPLLSKNIKADSLANKLRKP